MSEFSDSDFEPNLEVKIDIEPQVQSHTEQEVQSHIEQEVSNDLDWDNKDINFPRRLKSIKIINGEKTPSKVKINVVDDTSGTSSTSTSKISSEGEEHLHKKTIKIEKLLKRELDSKILNLCLEIKDIIEDNISVIKPSKKLGKEIVRFIRFTETINILNSYNQKRREKVNKNKYFMYTYRDLGINNNTKKLIKLVSENLNLLLDEEYEVQSEYLYN